VLAVCALLLACPASGAPIGERLRSISDGFLGTPYVLGPLGEGPEGEFDRDPLFSTAAFDCTTFVETTMALALAGTPAEATDLLRRIRYKDGVVGFATRNHFPEIDWLPNNIAAGFLTDATAQAAPGRHQTVVKRISKRDWYRSKTLTDLEGFEGAAAMEREERLRRLRALGEGMPDEDASVAYVPLEALEEALPRIPSGAIGSVVRAALPGKPVVVTHQLFLFDGPEGKFVRHAAFNKSVEDVPAMEYFGRFKDASWRVLGLNLVVVSESAR